MEAIQLSKTFVTTYKAICYPSPEDNRQQAETLATKDKTKNNFHVPVQKTSVACAVSMKAIQEIRKEKNNSLLSFIMTKGEARINLIILTCAC
jgi:hypothetical protein